MIDKVDKKLCCQCNNCINNCGKGAIRIVRSNELYEYPEIDTEKCVKCNLCEQVCPVLNPVGQSNAIRSYAAKNKDINIRLSSSSGGVFYAIASEMLLDGGVVYGAAFVDNLKVKHIRIENKKDLFRLQGSKYVRSELGNCFYDIQNDLREGKSVLFSGSPCQCAALKRFISFHGSSEKLYLADFVCHGVLSEKLFEEYIETLEKHRKSKIVNFCFRDKTNGWIDSGPKIEYENGAVDRWPLYEDLYMQGYFKAICMRESCYSCQYKNFSSGSDLTLGDFWGAEILIPSFYDDFGVSMICTNTNSGEYIFQKAKKHLFIQEVPLEFCIEYNKGLIKPFPKGEKSTKFYELANTKGRIAALRIVSAPSLMQFLKKHYYKIRRSILRKQTKQHN